MTSCHANFEGKLTVATVVPSSSNTLLLLPENGKCKSVIANFWRVQSKSEGFGDYGACTSRKLTVIMPYSGLRTGERLSLVPVMCIFLINRQRRRPWKPWESSGIRPSMGYVIQSQSI